MALVPYWQKENLTLYHGDSHEILPQIPRLSVDLIVTDPPYGIGYQSNRRNESFDKIVGDDDVGASALDLISMSLPSLKRSRHVYVFGLTNFGGLPIGGVTELIWNKEIMSMGDLCLPWGKSHETILFGVYNISKANRADGAGGLAARMRKGSVLNYQRVNAAGVSRHPTEKPVKLLRDLIESSSRFDEIVLDPFVGSGSTMEAAFLEGRGAIGIEIDEHYCEVTAKRLENVIAKWH